MKKHFVHQKIIKSMEKGRKKIQSKKKKKGSFIRTYFQCEQLKIGYCKGKHN